MKKFFIWLTFFLLLFAIYAPYVYGFILAVFAWLSALVAMRLWEW